MREGRTPRCHTERIMINDYTITHFVAYGPVRGECGHRHSTYAAAKKCAAKDQRSCRHSDRQVDGVWADKHGNTRRDSDWGQG